jgi:hypothetical protein
MLSTRARPRAFAGTKIRYRRRDAAKGINQATKENPGRAKRPGLVDRPNRNSDQ